MLKTTYSNRYALDFQNKQEQYILNDLAFKSESEIKNSSLIEQILLPTKGMLTQDNPLRFYMWKRYLQCASYYAYPRQFLDKVIGLSSKGSPEVEGFENDPMKKFYDYASLNGVDLTSVQMDAEIDIVKYGSCALLLVFPDDVYSFDATLKVRVIPGCDILDAGYKTIDEGGKIDYSFFVWKTEKDFMRTSLGGYERRIIVHIEAIDEDGNYYSAQTSEDAYNAGWDFLHPDERKSYSLIYPRITNVLNKIPIVCLNSYDLTLKWEDAYAQPIIDLNWHIFTGEADNNLALHQQSTAHLVIAGAPDKKETYQLGMGAVHKFTSTDAKEEYVAPQTAGISLQMNKLKEMKTDADNMLMNLVSSKNASGEALKLFIGDKTNGLIWMIKNVGYAIQLIAQDAAEILGADPDVIQYHPYINFSLTTENSSENIDDVTDGKNVDNQDVSAGSDTNKNELNS